MSRPDFAALAKASEQWAKDKAEREALRDTIPAVEPQYNKHHNIVIHEGTGGLGKKYELQPPPWAKAPVVVKKKVSEEAPWKGKYTYFPGGDKGAAPGGPAWKYADKFSGSSYVPGADVFHYNQSKNRPVYRMVRKTVPKKKAAPKARAPRMVSSAIVPQPRNASKAGLGRVINAGAVGLGTVLGGPVGGALGGLASSVFNSLTGLGKYKIKKNSFISGTKPVVIGKPGGTYVKHREFVTEITGTTAFTNTSYTINPTNPNLFPWLSAIALNFEQFTIKGMVFEYQTTSGTAVGSTNTALGTVTMATEYNAKAPPFTNLRSMKNYEFSTSSVPSQNFFHAIECEPSQTTLDVMYCQQPGSDPGDIRFEDWGNFQIATEGQQAGTTTVGELYVSYDIVFYKPRLTSGTLTTRWKLNGVTSGAPLGAGQPVQTGIGNAVVVWTPTTFTLYNSQIGQQYSFYISYLANGPGTSQAVVPTITSGAIPIAASVNDGFFEQWPSGAGATSDWFGAAIYFQTTQNPVVITMPSIPAYGYTNATVILYDIGVINDLV